MKTLTLEELLGQTHTGVLPENMDARLGLKVLRDEEGLTFDQACAEWMSMDGRDRRAFHDLTSVTPQQFNAMEAARARVNRAIRRKVRAYEDKKHESCPVISADAELQGFQCLQKYVHSEWGFQAFTVQLAMKYWLEMSEAERAHFMAKSRVTQEQFSAMLIWRSLHPGDK